jgi:uroporphyrinogen-III synthase
MLKGKVIINTGYKGADNLIGRALKNLGATVLSMPLIEICPVSISPDILLNITENRAYQWLVFTSKNGVNCFFEQLNTSFSSSTLPFRVAVFGKRTAMALKEKGFRADIVNCGDSAGDLLNDLMPKLRSEDKVLLVLGNLAANLLQERLAPVVKVERIDVYHTNAVSSVDKKVLKRLADDQYNLILFTSPSGFRSFKHHATGLVDISKLKTACLGPTTEAEVAADGIKPLVVAKPSGKHGLIKGIEDFFAAQPLEEAKVR